MNNILLIPDFYTPDECKAEIWYAERTGFKKQKYGATHTTEARWRTQIDDAERAAKIYSKLTLPDLETFYKDLKPDPLENLSNWKPTGLNERLRYYQYTTGQRFSRHFDIMFRINDNTRTFLTFIVYLDDDFEGGQTIFDNEIISPKMGSAILFPHELKHEGAVVTSGLKTVLRSDVVYTCTQNVSNS